MRWFAPFRARQPGAGLWRIAWWHFLHAISYALVGTCYRYRAWGTRNIPGSGPLLLVSNHQSYLDPILVGLGCHRRQFYALARSNLFNHAAFSWLIRSLNAIPVDRGETDMAAMRRCLEVLRQGHALLIFPEGTRTLDGTTHAFATGTMLLIKRARPWVLPVAIEGAYGAWPKGRALPRPWGRIGVRYGAPIAAEALIAMGPDAALEHLRTVVEGMRRELGRRMQGGVVGGGQRVAVEAQQGRCGAA